MAHLVEFWTMNVPNFNKNHRPLKSPDKSPPPYVVEGNIRDLIDLFKNRDIFWR